MNSEQIAKDSIDALIANAEMLRAQVLGLIEERDLLRCRHAPVGPCGDPRVVERFDGDQFDELTRRLLPCWCGFSQGRGGKSHDIRCPKQLHGVVAAELRRVAGNPA